MTSVSTAKKSSFWVTVAPSIGVSPIDHLFRTLDGIYMGRWKSLFRSDTDVVSWKAVWTDAFVEEKITPIEIKTAITACRRDVGGWPPTLPEFLAKCRPVLDYEASYLEALTQLRLRDDGKDSWSSPAIYWAAVRIGAFDLLQSSYVTMKNRWKACLDNAVAGIKSGSLPNVVPNRLDALPAPGRTFSPEVRAKNIEKINAMFSGALKKMSDVEVSNG